MKQTGIEKYASALSCSEGIWQQPKVNLGGESQKRFFYIPI